MKKPFNFVSKKVILDTESKWVYIGTLVEVDTQYYYLLEADAFDTSEVNITKHEYLMKVKKDGLVVNRKRVVIPKNKVIAITPLEDIIEE